jgi:hypothetical protein
VPAGRARDRLLTSGRPRMGLLEGSSRRPWRSRGHRDRQGHAAPVRCLKNFTRRWVIDAFSWTPLDVADRTRAALRVVDPKAQAVVKEGMRLGERRLLVEKGTSGRVYDDPKSDKAPQAVILRSDPLEVLTTFERYLVDASGQVLQLGPMIVRASLKRVPRGPGNEYGLIVGSAQISEKL